MHWSTRPFAIAAFVLAAGAAAGVPLRAGAVAPLVVDGDIADWADVSTVYLEDGPRITAVAHDGSFLYVHFRFSDLELARRVLHDGAIVWVDALGEREIGYGLRYRGSEAAQRALLEMEGSGDEPPEGPPRDALPPGRSEAPRGPAGAHRRAPLGALEVLRSGVTDEVIAGGARADGPAAACAVSDGVFTFEFRIPLADLAPPEASETPRSGRTLSVGFQLGGPTEAEREAMRERMGQAGPPGGGFDPGGGTSRGFSSGRSGHGGPPGGGRGPGGPDRAMQGPKTVWLDVTLSAAPAAER